MEILFQSKLFPEYRFLSNYHYHDQIDEKNRVWKTNEHFYQAMKCTDEIYQETILNLAKPNQTRTVGGLFITSRKQKALELLVELSLIENLDDLKFWENLKPIDDWHDKKFDVMRDGIRLKFLPGTSLSEKLLSTGDAVLIEWAPWDEYWGSGKTGNGENNLGKLLMERRRFLKNL